MSASGVWDWSGKSSAIRQVRIPQRLQNQNLEPHENAEHAERDKGSDFPCARRSCPERSRRGPLWFKVLIFRSPKNLHAPPRAQARSQLDVSFAGYARLLDVGQ